MITKHFNARNTTIKSFGITINFRNIFLINIMTQKITKKITKLVKEEAGGDEKRVLFCTRP